MNKYFILILLIFSSCKSIPINQISDEQKVFLKNIKAVEKFIKKGYIKKYSRFSQSIEYLQEKTNIESEAIEQFELIYTPTKENLNDWKKWYQNNKDKL